MELNTVHNIDFLNNDLPDKCANLIIADPPYYKVKGDFDFIWKTFDDYLVDVEKWCLECKRILADNGTLLWYGDAKNIAYAQIIFDKHFNLLNNIVWENTNDHKQQIRFNEDLRTFAPLTERILVYENINDCKDGFEPSYIRDYFQKYLMNERKKAGLSTKDINLICGYSENTRNKIINNEKNWIFITEKSYNSLATATGFFNKSYEDLRKKYEELRRPFNNALHLGDVIRLPNYETRKHDHDTVKPEKLTRVLITTCSRENDLVVVPFAGSGTECAMSVKEGRRFVGYEIESKYAKMAQDRAKKILKAPTLF